MRSHSAFGRTGSHRALFNAVRSICFSLSLKQVSFVNKGVDVYGRQLAINCTVSKSTGKSPMELLFGKKCHPPAIKLLQVDDDEPVEDLIAVRNACKERMDERSIQDKIRFDKGKAKIKHFQVGDFVLMRIHERHTTKLGPKFEGPMEILEILPNDRYKVKHINLRGCSEKIASHDYLRPAPVGQADPFDKSEECTAWADDILDKN